MFFYSKFRKTISGIDQFVKIKITATHTRLLLGQLLFYLFATFKCINGTFAENRDIEEPDLFEGDMRLTPLQRGYAMMGLDVSASNRQGAAIRTPLWPRGELIYDISPTLGRPF